MKNVNILLVEDNEIDILLTTEAFQEIRLTNILDVVRTGEEAIKYLDRRAAVEKSNLTLPDLILLDVNLPRINGL